MATHAQQLPTSKTNPTQAQSGLYSTFGQARSLPFEQPRMRAQQRLSKTEQHPVSTAKHRLFYFLVAGFVGMAAGASIDVAISMLHALLQPSSSGAIQWLFVWVLTAMGAVIGGVYGVQSADFFMGVMTQPDDSQTLTVSQFWLRVAMRVTAIAVVLWTIAMILI